MRHLIFLVSLISISLHSEPLSPVGKWKTIDDNTHKERSIVEITQATDGKLVGKILKVFPKPNEPDDPLCVKCSGERKDKHVIGMIFLWDLEKRDSDWGNGTILDPDNGETYRAKIQVVDEGQRLKVRGFIGISLFGRTQYWEKVQ